MKIYELGLRNYSREALLLIKLATTQDGTTPRLLDWGISSCLLIDNSYINKHKVFGVDYLIPAGLKDNNSHSIATDITKEIYLEDINEISPIGAEKLLITLKIDGIIYEAFCSTIKYGVIDELDQRPRYWKSFINLSGPDIAINHLNKYYKHCTSAFVDSLESPCILSIEPYIEKDIILDSNFSDWPNPYSARQEYGYKDINTISVSINRTNRTITVSDSFSKSSTRSDHDGGMETTEWTFRMYCIKKFGSLKRLEAQLKSWENKGIIIENGCISFEHVKYWTIEALLGIKFSFSNESSTYPA